MVYYFQSGLLLTTANGKALLHGKNSVVFIFFVAVYARTNFKIV